MRRTNSASFNFSYRRKAFGYVFCAITFPPGLRGYASCKSASVKWCKLASLLLHAHSWGPVFRLKMSSKHPKTLKKHDTAFQIEWKDAHVSWYPYPYLRQMCPCAECAIIRHRGQDIHSLFSPQGDGDVTLIEVTADIQPVDIQLVGRYALQFSWNDGHGSGIYPFDVLREICPCSECASQPSSNSS